MQFKAYHVLTTYFIRQEFPLTASALYKLLYLIDQVPQTYRVDSRKVPLPVIAQFFNLRLLYAHTSLIYFQWTSYFLQ